MADKLANRGACYAEGSDEGNKQNKDSDYKKCTGSQRNLWFFVCNGYLRVRVLGII